MLYFYSGFPRISLMFWRLTGSGTNTLLCHVFMQTCSSSTGHKTPQDLRTVLSWYVGHTPKVIPQVGVWGLFFFPFSLERSIQCKCTVDATSCQMQKKHAGLNHHLQYLESDVMPIVFPTFNVLFLMLQHGLCFSNSLMLWERSLHTRLNLFISNFHSANKLHKIISPFACIVWNSAITLHQILLPPSPISRVIRSVSPSLHHLICILLFQRCLCRMCPFLPVLSLPFGHYKAHFSRPQHHVPHRSVHTDILLARAHFSVISGSREKSLLQPHPFSFTCKYLFDPTLSLEPLHSFSSPNKTTVTSVCLINKPPAPGPQSPTAAHQPSGFQAS